MNVRMAEWQQKKKIMIAWPSSKELWQDDLALAQNECFSLIEAMHKEPLIVLVPHQQELLRLAARLGPNNNVDLIVVPFGDIWIRDTGPIAVKNERNESYGVIPTFNGWGQKYIFPEDLSLSRNVSALFGIEMVSSSLVFEGGALEFDAEGTLLTTRSCLIDKLRNPGLSEKAIENELTRLFGAKKIIWLTGSLKNDHTDGHIDTLARFIRPGVVALMEASDAMDPNKEMLSALKEQLQNMTDSTGRTLKLVMLPSPGTIKNDEGEIMPASYLNFIIGNYGVYMPVYDSPYDQQALAILEQEFSLPVVPLSAKAILTGGGAFHCMSQELF